MAEKQPVSYYEQVVSVCVPGGSDRPLGLRECCQERDRVIVIARAADAELSRLRAQLAEAEERADGLGAWECAECGARFAQKVNPVLLDGVRRCSSCVRADAAESALAASESKRKLLATECKAWRAVDDTCKDEQFSVLNDRMQDAFDARVATDAACALEGE